MRNILIITLILILIPDFLKSQGNVIKVKYGDNLQTRIEEAFDGDTLIIDEGDYKAAPTTFLEKECGNCIEHLTDVTATYGFMVSGKSLTLIGRNPLKTRLVTNAGYGLFFLNSPNSKVMNLTITGGKRDRDPNATNGGIVVKNSVVNVNSVNIKDNDNTLPEIIVGICGIVGRENSELIIEKCIIRNNSWDGVALYRGSKAIIKDNIIEQGRGVGIGITWNAKAVVYNNGVSYYWKGIGTFGNSSALVKNNLIYENLGWGIVITGTSYMELLNNIIDKNGNCGVALWDSSAKGKIYYNIISNNGWRDEWVCPQVGFWMNGDVRNLEFAYNNVIGNIMGDYRNINNLTGKDGNISIEPDFDRDYKLPRDSQILMHMNTSKGYKTLQNKIGRID